MDGEYQRLRTLVAAQGSQRAFRIGEIAPPQASEALQRLGLAGVAHQQADRSLWQVSTGQDDPGALLCLRCRVSQASYQKLQALHRQFGQRHQLDLIDMAATVLDDQGQPLPWQGAVEGSKRPEPFTMRVLRSFQPERASLATWSRVMLQSHPELVQLLRWHGLLMIRDWALLAHASPSRMERAWHLYGRSALPIARVRSLHRLFREQYAATAGTESGHWHPDVTFLRRLDPGTPPASLEASLLAMARALRLERLQTPPEVPWEEASQQGEEGRDWGGLRQQLNSCLQRALERQLPAMLGRGKADGALRVCLWRGFAEGLSQRALLARCAPGTKVHQSTVSRKLQLMAHATAIATTAAGELRGEQGFEELGSSLADTERIVAQLRTYLLEPRAAEGRPRLAEWLLPLLPPTV